ncbi:MAG: hypothetical protein K1X89_26035 [Myxococcaceae bacterium]|nr:hypothetical protein [Myxococcaceae bacterium]
MRIVAPWFAVVALVGCAQGPGATGSGGGDGSSGGGSTGSGGGTGASGGGTSSMIKADLPCDVAAMLNASCIGCHGEVLAQSAPMHLVNRDDFLAKSNIDPSQNYGQRSVVRMASNDIPMPPAPAAHVDQVTQQAFSTWVQAGMPAGNCAADAGTPTMRITDAGAMPCDVAAAVAAKCATCHQVPLRGAAPFPLLTRADFLTQSETDPTKTRAERSFIRMQDGTNPMPPVGYPGFTADEAIAFSNWVSGGTKEGTCDRVDAGTVSPLSCTSGQFWTFGNAESPNMNPGLACRACHTQLAPFRAYFFSGTVFPTLHEKDTCYSAPPSDAKVQIIDKNGNVALTMVPSGASGNFRSSSTSTNIAMPFTARITAGGRTATMRTPQVVGDCNACHTEQGANGAIGRLVWP